MYRTATRLTDGDAPASAVPIPVTVVHSDRIRDLIAQVERASSPPALPRPGLVERFTQGRFQLD